MLVIFDALIICVLFHFVVPMTVKIVEETQKRQIETQVAQKKHREK